MASKVIASLEPVAVAPLVDNGGFSEMKSRNEAAVTPTTASSDNEHYVEELGNGTFRYPIERDGQQVWVSWTKKEEARVVRKADVLLLPLFTVSDLANLLVLGAGAVSDG